MNGAAGRRGTAGLAAVAAGLAAPLIAALSGGTLLAALAFQYLGGLPPCALCLYQRYPHALVVLLALLGWWAGRRQPLAAALALASAMLALGVGAAIAGFHLGVEQQWWEGLEACGAGAAPAESLDALRARIMARPFAGCGHVAWSLFGISMAGYNLLISLALAVYAGWATKTRIEGMAGHGRGDARQDG